MSHSFNVICLATSLRQLARGACTCAPPCWRRCEVAAAVHAHNGARRTRCRLVVNHHLKRFNSVTARLASGFPATALRVEPTTAGRLQRAICRLLEPPARQRRLAAPCGGGCGGGDAAVAAAAWSQHCCSPCCCPQPVLPPKTPAERCAVRKILQAGIAACRLMGVQPA